MSNKYLQLLLIPMIMIVSAGPLTAEAFYDVNNGDKYFTSVSYLENAGVIQGYEDGTFKPENNITKAEALKMIMIASGMADESSLSAPAFRPFVDIEIDSWFAPYIDLARSNGVVNGNPDGSFDPEKNINLAEALKIVLHSFDPDADYAIMYDFLFNDTAEDAWYTKYTSYAASKGIINIYPSNTVNPTQEMSRGYTAEIIYRMIKSRDNGSEFGKATFYGGVPKDGVYTAAHKTLPFDSVVKVTNTTNGKTVNVTINDRGPWGPGRIIDLSSDAFSQLAPLGAGVINVEIEVVSTP